MTETEKCMSAKSAKKIKPAVYSKERKAHCAFIIYTFAPLL